MLNLKQYTNTEKILIRQKIKFIQIKFPILKLFKIVKIKFIIKKKFLNNKINWILRKIKLSKIFYCQ